MCSFNPGACDGFVIVSNKFYSCSKMTGASPLESYIGTLKSGRPSLGLCMMIVLVGDVGLLKALMTVFDEFP